MEEQKEHLQALTEIRSMMERSSRFISLSGLSGVFAGMFALAGAWAAHVRISSYLENEWKLQQYLPVSGTARNNAAWGLIADLFVIAGLVLAASLLVGVWLTMRASRKQGIKTWDATAKRLLINLLIPLVTGGLFCLILVYHGWTGLVGPATLLFYGLALLNASKYTLNDIRYLGICELIVGLVSALYPGYDLWFWAFGFGVLHIVYGTAMYLKYERNQ